jgi:hypothetical protein
MSAEKELSFHPSAMENFRGGGERLLSAVKPLQARGGVGQEFQADRHPVVSITEKDVTHIRRETVNSLTMEVSEIAFLAKDGLVGLTKEDIPEFDELAEAIQKTSDFKPRVSPKFVREAILDWLETKINERTDQELPLYLLDKARSAVKLFEIWVPLANLALESEIRFGHVRVRPLSAAILDAWFAEARDGKMPEELESLDQGLAKLRSEIQGLAAVYIAVRAERQFAVEKALEKAEEVAAAFRLFHPANSQPRAAFYCRTLGRENIESY